jgi:hypothetical protein
VSRIEGKRALSRAKRACSLRAFGLLAALTIGLGSTSCAADVRKAQATPPNGPSSPSSVASADDPPVSKSSPPPASAVAAMDETAPAPSPSSDTSSPAAPSKEQPPQIELPRGGRELFPAHRLVGFCGTPGAPALGRLAGNLTTKTKQLISYADKYGRGRKVLPVFELIAVVVQGAPGNDGKWRRRVPDSVVSEYLQAARAAKGILLLNIQPGHSDFVTEVKAFEKYLRQPDVGVALDPEWAMKGKQKPGAIFGQTTGAVINEVAEYMANIVKAGDLPEKALVFHQVNGHVVKDESVLVAHPGVVLIKSVDGLGPKGSKIKTYNFLVKTMPASVHAGFKLFFDEDKTNGGKLMSPEDVLALTPEPEYVMYE